MRTKGLVGPRHVEHKAVRLDRHLGEAAQWQRWKVSGLVRYVAERLEELIVDTVAVRLVDVDRSNWRRVVRVAPRRDQERFVGPVANYLCLCHYEGDWNPLAIEADGVVVGHVMWAIDEADDSIWMGGLVIDAASQRRGIGRQAVVAFIDRFSSDGRANLALSYEPDNVVARDLYAGLGFIETGETEGDEVIARHIG